MKSRWKRLPMILVVFVAVVAVVGYGATLFWSWGFVAWGGACIAICLTLEVALRRKAVARGVHRAYFGRPIEASIAMVLSAALLGAEKDVVVIGVVMFVLLIPTLWRQRREASRASNGGEN